MFVGVERRRMNSFQYTSNIEGNMIDGASLETINFSRLAINDPAEVAKLLDHSLSHGHVLDEVWN